MLISSRSYDEYVAMFDLDESTLPSLHVLDCSAGGSSFALHARKRGGRVVAVDPAYALGRSQLAETIADSNRDGATIAIDNADRFTWDWYGGREQRDQMRARALAEFVLDFGREPRGYVAAALPKLPFADDAFDLALCSHLLFTWADQLGHSWHSAALRELARVAREVRVFPTLLQGRGGEVPFWPALMADLASDGHETSRDKVPYEFQVGGNTMLVLRRATRWRSHPAR
ncbi:MAG TPA: methyltransferase domain-containing protein [Mycobacteriales bacterium]|nr:methyltransferase domain-containing protein [Mycobacteriales bacterium]